MGQPKTPQVAPQDTFPHNGAVTIDQVAAFLSLSKIHVRRLSLSGKLPPARRFGRSIRFDAAEVRNAWARIAGGRS